MTSVSSEKNILDALVTEMSGGTSRAADFAKVVQQQDHDHVCNRILMTIQVLQTRRREDKMQGRETNLKPEFAVTFIEQLMNKVCWSNRSYLNKMRAAEADDRANGLDFSQDVAEQLNIPHTDDQGVYDNVTACFELLRSLYTVVNQKPFLSYLDLGELHYFIQREVDEDTGAWHPTMIANSFAEALDCMEQALAQIEEKNEASVMTACNLDFDDKVSYQREMDVIKDDMQAA